MTVLEALRQTTESIRAWVEEKFLNKNNVDSALDQTSENPIQNKAVHGAINNLNTLVGTTSVSDQISVALSTKADATHTHDDRYYTETETDEKIEVINNSISNIDSVVAQKSQVQIITWEADD